MSENVTYVGGALIDNGPRKRAILSATTLKAAPGAGLASNTRGFARRLGRRGKTHTSEICKARDRSEPPLHKCVFSDT